VQRVWLALEEKQIPYQYIEVNPYNKPESLLKLNPRGLVPTLEVPNPQDPSSPKPLYESNIVLEYLEEAYPDHTPHFLPENNPYEKARARIWVDFVTSRVIPAFHRFLQYQPEANASPKDAEAGLEKFRTDFLGLLKTWISEADPEGPYFLGKNISLPDLVLAPWAIRLWVFDHFKGGLGLPAEGSVDDDQAWKRWRKWLKAIEARKSIQQTTSETEHYLPIYKRYADNVAQSELAKATRTGRGVP
jgi:glutathione S-transferase